MSVVKVIEVIGTSNKGWEDAIQTAIVETAKTVKNIRGIDVIGVSGKVENNKIVEFRANVKIAFVVER